MWEEYGVDMNLKRRINTRYRVIGALSAVLSSLILFSGCGVFVRKNAEKKEKILTINRLWRMHEDVNHVYFFYENGTVESGLILKWEKERIKVQKKDENIPVYIPAEGIVSIKAITGNRIWESLAAGSVLAAGYYVLTGAYDLGGESLGTVVIKMFGAPLIVMASVAYGASSEKSETYKVPENFEFDYDSIRIIHDITE
jgi:hypothetical protein